MCQHHDYPLSGLWRVFGSGMAWVCVACVVGLILLPQVAYGGFELQTRALSGTDGPFGPDLGSGVVFMGFDTAGINADGDLAFMAAAEGYGAPEDVRNGVWLNSDLSNTPKALVGAGGPLGPGLGDGVVFLSLASARPAINADGVLAFGGLIEGAGVTVDNRDGLWLNPGVGNVPLARSGTPDELGPGLGREFDTFGLPLLNDEGTVAFYASMVKIGVMETNDEGIWVNPGGGILPAVLEGSSGSWVGPGLSGGTFNRFAKYPALTPSGKVVFSGVAAVSTPTGVESKSGVWRWDNGIDRGNTPLALSGETGALGPGLGDQVSFVANIGAANANADGDAVFAASAQQPGIWLHESGVNNLRVRGGTSGEDGPGLGGDIRFIGFDFYAVNTRDQIVYQGEVVGSGVDARNNLGIWFNDGSGNTAVARLGVTDDLGPGLGDSMSFSIMGSPLLNAQGDIAFLAYLAVDGVNDPGNNGIWVWRSGQLTCVVRSGDLVDVDPSSGVDERQVKSVSMLGVSGGGNGRRSAFNDSGELTFNLTFTDGSVGVFVASTRLPGDLNGDGFVGIADLNIILGNWNAAVTPGVLLLGDTTGEGQVGIDDLNTVLSNWNSGAPPADAAVIPEPTTLAILTVGGTVLIRRRI